jgi:hypothetical protein
MRLGCMSMYEVPNKFVESVICLEQSYSCTARINPASRFVLCGRICPCVLFPSLQPDKLQSAVCCSAAYLYKGCCVS